MTSDEGTDGAREIADEGDGLDVADFDRVRVLTINRPHRLNALSSRLRERLSEEFLRCRSDKRVRVIVLTASGQRAFSAGADVKEIGSTDPSKSIDPMDQRERMLFEVMLETYKPTIAAVNGVAVGGGCELALACDLRIAVEGATFAMPEARLGLGATFGSVLLPRLLPRAIALRMLYTGDTLSAEEALRWGFVNRVVPAGELVSAAMELAQRIAANSPVTVQRTKHMALKGMDMSPAAAMRLDVGPNPYGSADRVEGISAFLEKRAAQWSD